MLYKMSVKRKIVFKWRKNYNLMSLKKITILMSLSDGIIENKFSDQQLELICISIEE